MRAPDSTPTRHTGANQVNLAVLAFFAIAAFFLLTEHRAHLVGAMPFLLLACPLLHFFMHHGHGGMGERQAPHDEGGGRA